MAEQRLQDFVADRESGRSSGSRRSRRADRCVLRPVGTHAAGKLRRRRWRTAVRSVRGTRVDAAARAALPAVQIGWRTARSAAHGGLTNIKVHAPPGGALHQRQLVMKRAALLLQRRHRHAVAAPSRSVSRSRSFDAWTSTASASVVPGAVVRSLMKRSRAGDLRESPRAGRARRGRSRRHSSLFPRRPSPARRGQRLRLDAPRPGG